MLVFEATISNYQLHVSYAQFSNGLTSGLINGLINGLTNGLINGLTQNLNSACHIQSENWILHFCSSHFNENKIQNMKTYSC